MYCTLTLYEPIFYTKSFDNHNNGNYGCNIVIEWVNNRMSLSRYFQLIEAQNW